MGRLCCIVTSTAAVAGGATGMGTFICTAIGSAGAIGWTQDDTAISAGLSSPAPIA